MKNINSKIVIMIKCNFFSNCITKPKSTSDKLQIFMFVFDTVKCDGSDEEEVKVRSELSVNIFFLATSWPQRAA